MKSHPISLLEFVEHDLRHAVEFYDTRQPEGGEIFFQRFLEITDRIGWNPEQFPQKYLRFRRAIIRRSYYGVFFAIEPAACVLVAVLDLRQDPRVIRSLLKRRSQPG